MPAPDPKLPDDIDALKAMVTAMAEQQAQVEARNADLEARNKQLEAVNRQAGAVRPDLSRPGVQHHRHVSRESRLSGGGLVTFERLLSVKGEVRRASGG